MAIPEVCYIGGTLYITGRVIGDVDITGWQPYIKFGDGVSIDPIPGVWTNLALKEFYFTIPKDTTRTFPEGKLDYEVYIELPSDEVIVVTRGSFDVVPRL